MSSDGRTGDQVALGLATAAAPGSAAPPGRVTSLLGQAARLAERLAEQAGEIDQCDTKS